MPWGLCVLWVHDNTPCSVCVHDNTPCSVCVHDNTPSSLCVHDNTPCSVCVHDNTYCSVWVHDNTPLSVWPRLCDLGPVTSALWPRLCDLVSVTSALPLTSGTWGLCPYYDCYLWILDMYFSMCPRFQVPDGRPVLQRVVLRGVRPLSESGVSLHWAWVTAHCTYVDSLVSGTTGWVC